MANEYRIEPDLLAELSSQPSLRMMAVQSFAEKLNAETERWCWKAVAQGVGNRVWRSEPHPMEWPSHGVTYRFAILKPGEPPPGSGTVFGPFSQPA